MNVYLIIILAVIFLDYLLDTVVGLLNVRHATTSLPEEFAGWYDFPKYKKSQGYLKERTFFSLMEDTVFTIITLLMILRGGFNYVDHFARSFRVSEIVTGLIFAVVIMFVRQILHIPFSLYSIFKIEEKFGFNRMTPKTFVLDFIKSLVIGVVIGSIVFSAVIWFFIKAGSSAWIYCWVVVSLFQLFLLFIAPVVIMPLFNKFIPLKEGDLKTAIEDYSRKEKFALKGVFTMDGSRRSSKTNAFFTGFGKFRRIVLFDTLIQNHMVEELMSVLAHEMGHYKKKHIFKMIIMSVMTTGLMFFFLALFINNVSLFAAFKMDNLSVYASLFFFGFLYTPINMIFSIFHNILSRRYEYEADFYAVRTYNQPEAMIRALKKLSVDNLSNLTPHPLKVFLDYSHPPVLARIRAIKGYHK